MLSCKKSIIKELILRETNSTHIVRAEKIQNLWSEYGELTRVVLNDQSVIIKLIKFPKEHKSKVSHSRKVKSYQVEKNWYLSFNKQVEFAYSPKLISQGEANDQHYILLEDLNVSGYKTKKDITWKEVKLCLKWLAAFHNNYLDSEPKGLWNIGTYWHLETRPDELKVIADQEFKKYAHLIDKRLNSAKYKTIVHGDAKLANFLFNESSVAAVDFQYVGGGVGVKDVAYFLSSIYTNEELIKNETKCLDYYFKELNNKDVEEEWRELYLYAYCDFIRFLEGWSPDHWKLNSYTKCIKEDVLKLYRLCDIAKGAALSAGVVINNAQGTKFNIQSKESGSTLASSIVTEIDHQAQEAILKLITPTLKKYDFGLLTEENPDDHSRFKKEYFWCIDPLDGTLQFSQNEEGYSVSIALVSKNGESLIGVVFNPRTNELYYAIKGHGAYKNDSPLIIKNKKIDTTYYSAGPSVMNAIKTIENAPAVFYKKPKEELGGGCLWDFAATSIIHSEAGGYSSDYSNRPIDLNSKESTYMNTKGVKYCSDKNLEID